MDHIRRIDLGLKLAVDLKQASRRVSAAVEPFCLSLDQLGCFPSPSRARVLWIGGEAPPPFCGLVRSLEHELGRMGFPPDRKPTIAHATLARIKGRPDPRLVRILEDGRPDTPLEVPVERIALMESIRSAQGAAYSPLFTTPLSGGGHHAV